MIKVTRERETDFNHDFGASEIIGVYRKSSESLFSISSLRINNNGDEVIGIEKSKLIERKVMRFERKILTNLCSVFRGGGQTP